MELLGLLFGLNCAIAPPSLARCFVKFIELGIAVDVLPVAPYALYIRFYITRDRMQLHIQPDLLVRKLKQPRVALAAIWRKLHYL
jgi:hypothetical protein